MKEKILTECVCALIKNQKKNCSNDKLKGIIIGSILP